MQFRFCHCFVVRIHNAILTFLSIFNDKKVFGKTPTTANNVVITKSPKRPASISCLQLGERKVTSGQRIGSRKPYESAKNRTRSAASSYLRQGREWIEFKKRTHPSTSEIKPHISVTKLYSLVSPTVL